MTRYYLRQNDVSKTLCLVIIMFLKHHFETLICLQAESVYGLRRTVELTVLHSLARKNRIAFKKHALLRMLQRDISSRELKEALFCCRVIKEYPDDKPLPIGTVI